MYSGTTLTKASGRLLGAHQKIDRVACRHLRKLGPGQAFPSKRLILHFEGGKGPDAIKRKSPAKDEPWHYFQPADEKDVQLLDLIEDHYNNLVAALKANDDVRAAFEAAWVAHAIVDGLTPAHQYPYEAKLVELRSGQGIETRTTIKEKLFVPGATKQALLHNNWKLYGPGGLFTSHSVFEMGVATLLLPLRLRAARPTPKDLKRFSKYGLRDWFRLTAKEVAALGIYERFLKWGWTMRLAYQVQRRLAPHIAKAVTIVWYNAAKEAAAAKPGVKKK